MNDTPKITATAALAPAIAKQHAANPVPVVLLMGGFFPVAVTVDDLLALATLRRNRGFIDA